MIPVRERRIVPVAFNSAVTIPGSRWLAENSDNPELPPYWRKGMPELRRAYKGICAYFCCYVAPATGGGSTDHFVPKSSDRSRAYDWSNYRFSCALMNSRKRDAGDVLDPFSLTEGWFELYFPTMRVRPSPGLNADHLKQVRATITRLKLSSSECMRERAERWTDYVNGEVSANHMYRHAPMIAMEAVREGLMKPQDNALSAAEIRAWLDS